MDMKKTCCFTGHRLQGLRFSENSVKGRKLEELITNTVIHLITVEGVTHFISGMAIGVDLMAARIVLDLKNSYSKITLECALPCETQAERWSENQREIYYQILAKCDDEYFVQKHYSADYMQKRNMYMVDNSNFVIAVWNGKPSGTYNTIKYAQKQNRKIIRIDPSILAVTEV